jgi:predicted nuclease of predicted toxin-antitoxin system
MNPLGYPLLADENIHRDVVAGLRTRGLDVLTVFDAEMVGHPDLDILNRAQSTGRVILTHDSDFGVLALRENRPFLGIAFLRPGHIHSEFVLDIVDAVRSTEMVATPPFLLVAERRSEG